MIKPVSPANSFVMGKHRIYMLPTRYGIVFAVLVFIILLASINYGNGMGYGLSFLLAAVGFMSMIYTHRNLLHVRVATTGCNPVFAGEAAHFAVNISSDDNNSKIGIELRQNKRDIDNITLSPGEHNQIQISCPTYRRGYVSAPKFRLLTRFPFGLVYTWSRDIVLSAKCLVYPKPADRFFTENNAGGEGHSHNQIRKPGEDFYGLREFVRGDSPRRIHWRASARSNNLVTKEYTEDSNSIIWLDWNNISGDTETRLSLLCRGVLDAQATDRHYGLKLPGTEIQPSTGHKHQHNCLKALACFGAA